MIDHPFDFLREKESDREPDLSWLLLPREGRGARGGRGSSRRGLKEKTEEEGGASRHQPRSKNLQVLLQ